MIKLLATSIIIAAAIAEGAGPRNHMWAGRRAIDLHVDSTAVFMPELSKMLESVRVRRSFYLGTAFPDWGYEMGSHQAAEAAHWEPFQRSYLEYLKSEISESGTWSAGQIRRIAFFMGVVTHGLVDIPWHFGPDSLLNRTLEIEGAGHGRTEYSAEIISFSELGIDVPIGLYNWPNKDLIAVYDQMDLNVSRVALNTSLIKMNAGWHAAKAAAPILTRYLRGRHPWLSDAYKNHHFGGLEHGGAASAIALREIYARMKGGYFLQQGPEWERHHSAFAVYRGCRTATIFRDLPNHNSGREPWMAVGETKAGEAAALVRFDLSDIPKDFEVGSAKLIVWAEVGVDLPKNGRWLELVEIAAEWSAGRGLSDDVDGVYGTEMPPDSRGVRGNDWERLLGQGFNDPRAQTVLRPNPASVGVPLPHLDAVWIAWDVGEVVASVVRGESENNGWAIRFANRDGCGPGMIRILSSDALKNQSDGMGGGTRIAYRPILIIAPASSDFIANP